MRTPRWPFGRQRAAVVGGATLVLAVASVEGCLTPTQIMLTLTTDLSCEEFAGASITATTPDEAERVSRSVEVTSCTPSPGGTGATLGSLVLVPSGARDAELSIRVVAARSVDLTTCTPPNYGPGCIVARRKLHYVAHQALELPIALRGSCAGVPCDADRTCVGGGCVDATIANPSTCAAAASCGEELLTTQDGAKGEGGAGGSGSSTDHGAGGGDPTGAARRAACAAKLGVATVRFAFVTTETVRPEGLKGIVGANAYCNAVGVQHALGTNYRAWLSDSNPANAPANTFQDGAPWVRVDCGLVAHDKADLLDGSLGATLDMVPDGTQLAPTKDACSLRAFSNTNANGTTFLDPTSMMPEYVCGDWQTKGTEAAILEFGTIGSTDAKWALNLACAAKGSVCNGTHEAHLYCFEQ